MIATWAWPYGRRSSGMFLLWIGRYSRAKMQSFAWSLLRFSFGDFSSLAAKTNETLIETIGCEVIGDKIWCSWSSRHCQRWHNKFCAEMTLFSSYFGLIALAFTQIWLFRNENVVLSASHLPDSAYTHKCTHTHARNNVVVVGLVVRAWSLLSPFTNTHSLRRCHFDPMSLPLLLGRARLTPARIASQSCAKVFVDKNRNRTQHKPFDENGLSSPSSQLRVCCLVFRQPITITVSFISFPPLPHNKRYYVVLK